MAGKEVTPQLALDSYSCPHCGALAHQFWFYVHPQSFERDKTPRVIGYEEMRKFAVMKREDSDEQKAVDRLFERFRRNEVTFDVLKYGSNGNWQMLNMFLSRCHACDGFAVWIKDGLVWPAKEFGIEPHEDMPPDVKEDFIEAAAIVDRSPRGAAALLRLAMQKLMVDLGEKGKNLNDDIASLVEKGLETSIQKALDVVRVIGNNAVHPGELDIKDDKATATALLSLVNIIVDRRIAATKRIDEMFANLPPVALEAIAKRDKAD
jgi:hypothetical protein